MTLDLASLGWDAEFAAAFTRCDLPGTRPARVTRVDRGISTVLGVAGAERASMGGTHLLRASRDPLALPCAGDWVAVRTWPDRRVTLETVLPRRTQVLRNESREHSTRGQVLAANVDVLAVVEPIDPAPDLGRVERLLALAYESGACPVVLLTKADRAKRPAVIAHQVAAAAAGAEVHPVSARTGAGLEIVAGLV